MLTLKDLQEYTRELQKKITWNSENLYAHYITLQVGTNQYCTFRIDNNYGFDMTFEQMQSWFQTNCSYQTSEIVQGKFLPASGLYYNTSYNPGYLPIMGIAWASNRSGFVVAYNTVSAGTDWSGFMMSSIFAQKTVPIIINNALKPSYKTFTTDLQYNGSKIGDITWTLAKYPTGDGKFHYKWFAKGNGSVNITWEYWSSGVTWSYVTKLAAAIFPSGYGSDIYRSGVFDLNLYGVSAILCKDVTSTNFRAYFERPSTYASGSQNIYFSAQADYITNN